MASDERRNIFAELKTDPYYADQHNFYKVEKWSRNGLHVHA